MLGRQRRQVQSCVALVPPAQMFRRRRQCGTALVMVHDLRGSSGPLKANSRRAPETLALEPKTRGLRHGHRLGDPDSGC